MTQRHHEAAIARTTTLECERRRKMIRVTYTRSLGMAALGIMLLTGPAAAAPGGGMPMSGAQETAATASGASVTAAVPSLNCSFAKMRAALRESAALNGCFRHAIAAGTAADPACVDAAEAKLQATFDKIDARGGCSVTGDAPTVGFLIDQCSVHLAQLLSGQCLPAGSQCGNGVFSPCCAGLRCIAIFGAPQATCG